LGCWAEVPDVSGGECGEGSAGLLVAGVGWRHGRTDREEATEHTRILTAYEQGDASQAAELMRQHIDTALTHILQRLPTR
jgi:DNA-binding GntR family transcriptional regulator